MIVPSLKSRYVSRSAHFAPSELYDGPGVGPGELLVFGPLLELAEAVRAVWGPLRVNAGVRTEARQRELRRRGYKAASYSPHVWRCALDLDTRSDAETKRLVELVRATSKKSGIPVRIGHMQYARAGQTFVHVDVAPVLARAALTARQIPAWVYASWSVAGLEW